MISTIPKYEPGKTYFLSHRSGLPSRIYIEAVYAKPESPCWMYSVYSEGNGNKPTYISESILDKRISKHSSKVYGFKEIKDRMNAGFRFCGNYSIDLATKRGKEFAEIPRISSVMLYPAINTDGDTIYGEYGVWIKWDTIITEQHPNMAIKIK